MSLISCTARCVSEVLRTVPGTRRNWPGLAPAVDFKGAPAQGAAGLRGAPILATDLRASVSLIIAGLVAQGPPTNSRQDHLGSRKRALDGCAGMPQRTRLCRQSADVRRAGRITESSREGLRGVERYFLDSQSKHNAQQSRALLLAVPANF
jgi:hypothetical protein